MAETAEAVTDITTVAPKATRAAKTVPEPQRNIFELINLISKEAGALEPVSKGGVPFAFRGIDGTVAHLSPFMRKYGVIVVPSVQERNVVATPVGTKTLTGTDILTTYTFYAPDGSSFPTTVAGYATDYADRSTAQAQSVALRVALLQVFFLPTHSPDPEETSVTPDSSANAAPSAPAGSTARPAAPPANPAKALQGQIKTAWETQHGAGDTGYVKLGNEKFPQGQDTWINDKAKLTALLDAVNKGEVPA